jgi:hypothetical protein
MWRTSPSPPPTHLPTTRSLQRDPHLVSPPSPSTADGAMSATSTLANPPASYDERAQRRRSEARPRPSAIDGHSGADTLTTSPRRS